ncbi:MAG: Hsp20/alpha crystallin family protein [Spongiibacteraceae bacterium]|jgi:HSP20 family protein
MRLNTRDSLFDLETLLNGRTLNRPAIKRTAVKPSEVSTQPKVDIYDNGDSYELIAELPGIGKEAISVTVEESTLTIEATSQQQSPTEKTVKALRQERHFGKFVRSFNLGQDIDQTDIQASFKDGLLTLTVPKIKEEIVQPRKIEIH